MSAISSLRLEDQILVIIDVVQFEFEGGGHDGVELGNGQGVDAHLAIEQALAEQDFRGAGVVGIPLQILGENLLGFDEFVVVLRGQGQFEEGLALEFRRGVGFQDDDQRLRGQGGVFLMALPLGEVQLELEIAIRHRRIGGVLAAGIKFELVMPQIRRHRAIILGQDAQDWRDQNEQGLEKAFHVRLKAGSRGRDGSWPVAAGLERPSSAA